MLSTTYAFIHQVNTYHQTPCWHVTTANCNWQKPLGSCQHIASKDASQCTSRSWDARALNSACTMSSANTSSHLMVRMSNTRKSCCLYMQPNDRQLPTLNESSGGKAFQDKHTFRPYCLIFKVSSFWN